MEKQKCCNAKRQNNPVTHERWPESITASNLQNSLSLSLSLSLALSLSPSLPPSLPPVWLSLYLPVWLSLYLSVYQFTTVYHSLYISTYHIISYNPIYCNCISIWSGSICLSLYEYIDLWIDWSFDLRTFFATYLPVSVSPCLAICLSLCLRLSSYLLLSIAIKPSVYLTTHL